MKGLEGAAERIALKGHILDPLFRKPTRFTDYKAATGVYDGIIYMMQETGPATRILCMVESSK
jgi:hypothetical protein